jgi:soluble lytic murein transglycosylase-like protein
MTSEWRGAAAVRRAAIGFAVAVVLVSAASVDAEVWVRRDAAGIFHFSNRPSPGSEVYRPARPLATSPLRDPAFAAAVDRGAYDAAIDDAATRYGVEPELVKAVVRAESGFNRHAISPKGARGLMQLMPQTARRHGVMNPFDATENIAGGVKHLRMLLDRYGKNLPWALAAYNAGEEPVERYHGIPPYDETRTYVSRVLRFRQQYLRKRLLGREARS